MSIAYQNNLKRKRKVNRKKAKTKDGHQKLIGKRMLAKKVSTNLNTAISKPKKFPDEVYNEPKKKNKSLVDKFKALFKRKTKK